MKNQNKTIIAGLMLLTMFSTSIAYNNVYAQTTDAVRPDLVRPTDVSVSDVLVSDISTIVPEISDVKPTDVFEVYPQVKFSGETDGWSIIGGYAFETKIYIEGKAVRGDDGKWKVKAEGKMKIEDRDVKLLLKGKAYNGHLRLHGTGVLDSGLEFRIHLSGSYAPTLVENEYALGFKGAYVKFSDNGFRIPLMQVGKASVYPVTNVADTQ